MRKVTIYSRHTCGGNEYVVPRSGYLIGCGCGVYKLSWRFWYVIDIATGLWVCGGRTREEAISKFDSQFKNNLENYRTTHANDYHEKTERMNALYEDYVKGAC